MKKTYLHTTKVLFALLTLVSLGLFTSCTNSVADDAGTTKGESATTREVTLKLSEEQVTTSTTSTTPMVRAVAAKSYYAINVYVKKGKGYEKFAYGLFDSPKDLKIVLQEGKKYKFECVKVENDKDTVYHDGDSYLKPFQVNGEPGTLTNRFVYSKEVNNDGMTEGVFSLTDSKTTRYPRVYTNYGELIDYDPATADSAKIPLRRSYFGLHFVVEPPKDGYVVFKYLENYSFEVHAGNATFDQNDIYTFHQIVNSTKEGYGGNIKLYSYWYSSNGAVSRDTTLIPLTRNTITTVNVSLHGSTPAGIGVSEEDGPMGNRTVDIRIDGGKE